MIAPARNTNGPLMIDRIAGVLFLEPIGVLLGHPAGLKIDVEQSVELCVQIDVGAGDELAACLAARWCRAESTVYERRVSDTAIISGEVLIASRSVQEGLRRGVADPDDLRMQLRSAAASHRWRRQTIEAGIRPWQLPACGDAQLYNSRNLPSSEMPNLASPMSG